MTRRREDKDNADVITDTFFLCTVSHFALIDIGFTHSYVAKTISMNLNISVERTTSVVSVVSPLGKSVRVDRVFRRVPLEIQGVVFSMNSMELSFGKFNLILGMDWLVKHRVSLDCTTKRVTLRTRVNSKIVLIGERRLPIQCNFCSSN